MGSETGSSVGRRRPEPTGMSPPVADKGAKRARGEDATQTRREERIC